MTIFPLTIFPEGGLASSVITTVWVGVFVLCFFNLRYGWVLSGLVVPGYLVPLLIVKPLAALIILIEAVLSYAIVWLFSEKLARGRFPSLFGRDRFMGLILASIAVRLTMDGYLLPELADWLDENFDRRIDWESNLQSFGLVIISLLANQFWKPGLVRGFVATVVTIGLTWLIIRYGLMEFTNFRISGVSYLYEGLASSILASPKAYIILVLTAMIASHMNVRYGWDFSGILIPALIALQWYQPTKILSSFLEAIVIYVLARLILKLPMMANVTLEGGRKLLLFFNISFAWKMALGWWVVWQGIEVKTTDLFGFGYLLSTLIAIKAHDKDIFPRLARSTLQVSLVGAVLGNVVGFGLSAATTRMLPTPERAKGLAVSQTPQLDALMVTAIGDAHVRKQLSEARPLGSDTARALSDLIELLEASEVPSIGAIDVVSDNWHVQRIEGGRLAISRADGQGREALVFDPAATRQLALVLNDPTQAQGLGVAALQLLENQRARWLIIAAPTLSSTLGQRNVIDVFGEASNAVQLVVAVAQGDTDSHIDFANSAPQAIDLSALRREIPGLAARLRVGELGASGDSAVLSLGRPALERLARSRTPAPSTPNTTCRLPALHNLEPAWSELEQLAYLRYEIAEPLYPAIAAGEEPVLTRAAARMGGFELEQCRLGGRTHWSMYAPSRLEAQLYLAEGEAPERTVISYREGSRILPMRLATAFHRTWKSDALLVLPYVDTHLRETQTSSDVLWQALVRAQQGTSETQTFQLRPRIRVAMGFRSSADVILAADRMGEDNGTMLPILSTLREAGLRAEGADDDRGYAGFEIKPGMVLRYLDSTPDHRYFVGYIEPWEEDQS
jgi:hypothetical protein